ncbi:UDP-N-acetyl-D-mannosamine dehydrogenase, partial [Candidatus Shapirobacteria bacterium CG10_big_fil_rev_8_21_14_0_10_36_6]
MQTVQVIGLGYIGLPTAALLATKGFSVIGVDTQANVVDNLNNGKIHLHEPGLDILLKSALGSGNFLATTSPRCADIHIICVPTPFKNNHEPDLSYIQSAISSLAPILNNSDLVILESTSPVGTTLKVRSWLLELRPELNNVQFAYCPERVIPGKTVLELIENDRVIGGITTEATTRAADFYKCFVEGEVLLTTAKTAELCKLAENAYRDINIAYANELSMVCDQFGINPYELIKLTNHHPRVNILQPGPGVGGHCIAIDPWFIIDAAPKLTPLLQAGRTVNNKKPEWVVNKIKASAQLFDQPTILCLGLSYKANIDDLRESPALSIAKQLTTLNIGDIIACEPHINTCDTLKLFDLKAGLEQANIIVILVNHDAFTHINWPALSNAGKQILDFTGITTNFSAAQNTRSPAFDHEGLK